MRDVRYATCNKLTHKTSYWNTLLRIERQDERDDHNLLMIYRIMHATRSMGTGSDYMEMAQLLGDAALPAEAVSVLEDGLFQGVVPPEQKERWQRLTDSDVVQQQLRHNSGAHDPAPSPRR